MSIDATKHSLFGASKVAADVLVQEYGRYFGMKTAVFRGGCLTGPDHSGAQLHGFLAYLMRCAVEGMPYTVFGYKGKQVRDNIHSHDSSSAFDHFYRAPRVGRGLQHRRRPIQQLLHARGDRALRGDRRQAPRRGATPRRRGRRSHLVDQRHAQVQPSTFRTGRSEYDLRATLEQMLEQSRGAVGLTERHVPREQPSARWSALAKRTGGAIRRRPR